MVGIMTNRFNRSLTLRSRAANTFTVQNIGKNIMVNEQLQRFITIFD